MPELVADVPDELLTEVADEWTEPMPRASTDPFEPPPRPALEQPAARDAADRAVGLSIAARRLGKRGRPIAALVAAASVVVAVLATDSPRDPAKAQGEDAQSFPISELTEPAALSDAGICEPDPLAPAPALPAAAPAPARRTSASRPATSEPSDPAADESPTSTDDPEAGEAPPVRDSNTFVDDVREQMRIPGSEAPTP